MFIQSENRYLWYKEEIIDEKYLPLEEIGNRKVNYDDYICSEKTKTLSKPDESENRIIEEEKIEYSENDIIAFRISGNIELSEIEFLEKDTLKIIDIKNKDDYKYLFDGKYSVYNKLNQDIILYFDKRNIDNILFYIYHKNDNSKMKVEYLVSSSYALYEKEYTLNNKSTEIIKEELNKNSYNVNYYTYCDKLYKTYLSNVIYNDEYLANLDGYLKDESSKKTYYRYITDEYVYVRLPGNTVVPRSHCFKRICVKIKVTKNEIPKEEPLKEEKPKEKKVIYNPKTIDTIYVDIILLIISIICTLFVFKRKIFLVLSNRFKVLKKYSRIFL